MTTKKGEESEQGSDPEPIVLELKQVDGKVSEESKESAGLAALKLKTNTIS